MSIFNKQNNPDKWKNKYFDLLDENETLEKTNEEREDLLCKTIIRLSFATMGVNKDLDPYLKKIRTQLKKGLKTEDLKDQLEHFSNALMTMEEVESEDAHANVFLLFDFLIFHFSGQEDALLHLKNEFINNNQSDEQSLFVAINELIQPVTQVEPKVNDAVLDALPINGIDIESVLAHLQHLLDNTEIPEELDSQAQELKEKLRGNEPFSSVLDETISFLFQIKKHVQSEQKEITNYLAELTDQLAELGAIASGAQSSSKVTIEKRNLLDQSVSLQMTELQNSSKNATQLEPLKQLINTRLATISQQIHDHQLQEEAERNKNERVELQLEALSTKITTMEKESRKLKNKLCDAQKKAIHDPLTGLPNRLAYDERLKVEIYRWKRYRTPISLLIWDIDFFKKINDNYGHKAGDKTLILISKLLSSHCRETDFVSRFGGEEFTMLLSNTDGESALLAANKIRKIIEKSAFNSNGEKISITISCGVTQFIDDDSDVSAFNRADKALYEAKHNGRNQCKLG